MEDKNMLGRRFTWYHPNGRAMIQIDSVLISGEWNTCRGDISLGVFEGCV